jgi:hypothetical protein
MAYQEVKTTSYGKRVGNSFRGIGGGLALFIIATCLLWWNEGRAVKRDKVLKEAEKAYVVMENPDQKDPALDGELVCATAVATTQDSLSDRRFGIGAKAISLQRDVEYYQWVEHAEEQSEDKLGGKEVTTTTYTYSKQWTSSPVSSENFKDPEYQGKNTVLTTVEREDQWAQDVRFGAYQLNESLIRSISSREKLDVNVPEAIRQELDKSAQAAHDRFYGASPDSVRTAFVHQSGNELYFGQNPAVPEVGDVRVTWSIIVPAKVTIIAQVDGDTFKAYKTKNGDRYETLVMGKKDADEIFESEHQANSMWLWVLRILGIILVICGLKGIVGFLETILKVVPFLANIFGWGVGVVCSVAGVAWSLIVIAVAWVFYRPVLGITLLVLAAFLVWVFAFKGKDQLKKLAGKTAAGEDAGAN